MSKAFLLGVGCQKGGTTWLHNQLKQHPSVDLGFRKGYHVLDTLFVAECGAYDPAPRGFAKRIYHRLGAVFGSHFHRLESFKADLDRYFDYFLSLVERSPGVRLTGDITPSYAGLPVIALHRVKRSLIERGFDVKVVFLMRDPVERVMGRDNHLVRSNDNHDGRW